MLMADPVRYEVSYTGGRERWFCACDRCGWLAGGFDQEQDALADGEQHALWHG